MFGSASDNTITPVSIVGKKVFVIRWNYLRQLQSLDLRILADIQLSGLQMSFMHSGAPFTYTLKPGEPKFRTITLALRSCDTNSYDFKTPSSIGVLCKIY